MSGKSRGSRANLARHTRTRDDLGHTIECLHLRGISGVELLHGSRALSWFELSMIGYQLHVLREG
jgi:hypothetical protein